MNKTEKQVLIDALHADFGKSPHAILVDFRGLTVPAVTGFGKNSDVIYKHTAVRTGAAGKTGRASSQRIQDLQTRLTGRHLQTCGFTPLDRPTRYLVPQNSVQMSQVLKNHKFRGSEAKPR